MDFLYKLADSIREPFVRGAAGFIVRLVRSGPAEYLTYPFSRISFGTRNFCKRLQ